ncbi:protein LKAAEAR1-like [Carcharodon carcharias]|uniref:protein LKAAEAR1-like n=1 Tax=Carcharodon carcharias TaxID=13397 RepID=UPI001B7D9CFF|nr:protein LKAAEAR1-like [Carcharodon carcharias]
MSEKEIKTNGLISEIDIKANVNLEKTVSQQTILKGLQKAAPNAQKYPKIGAFIIPGPDALLDCNQQLERKKRQNLIGQLKAAESHNRIQSMRLRYQKMRAEEINHLISSQPTARKAIRLEALLPPWHEKINLKDTLEKLERKRVEEIMNDEAGLTINRII